MDRAQASRLVGKLQALAADPAATEAEKALAGAKAEALSARFRLGVAEQRRPPRQARRRYRNGRVWVVSPDSRWGLEAFGIDTVEAVIDEVMGAKRGFHVSTGKGSPNVKVEHHWGDWKITVDIGWVTRRASRSADAATGRSPVRPAGTARRAMRSQPQPRNRPYARGTVRFGITIRTSNFDEDYSTLARAKFQPGALPEGHIDMVVEAGDPEAARQQVSQTLGRDREDYVFVETKRLD